MAGSPTRISGAGSRRTNSDPFSPGLITYSLTQYPDAIDTEPCTVSGVFRGEDHHSSKPSAEIRVQSTAVGTRTARRNCLSISSNCAVIRTVSALGAVGAISCAMTSSFREACANATMARALSRARIGALPRCRDRRYRPGGMSAASAAACISARSAAVTYNVSHLDLRSAVGFSWSCHSGSP